MGGLSIRLLIQEGRPPPLLEQWDAIPAAEKQKVFLSVLNAPAGTTVKLIFTKRDGG